MRYQGKLKLKNFVITEAYDLAYYSYHIIIEE